MIRRTILILSFLGAGFFAGAFFLSLAKPLLVEQGARRVLQIEIEHRVGEKLDDLSDSRIASFAQRALGRTEAQVEATRQDIRDDVALRVAEVVANMLDANCACRKRLVESARRFENERLGSLLEARQRLSGLIESAYASVSRSLIREFRIFTASNAAAFALLALVGISRSKANLQLVLPALVVFGAVALSAALYLFNQDWLHTIVFGDYLGWGYAAYLSLVVLLLADILLNRARVTTHLLNLAFSAVGSAVSVAPC